MSYGAKSLASDTDERIEVAEKVLDFLIEKLKANNLGQLRMRIGDVTITIVEQGQKAIPEGET